MRQLLLITGTAEVVIARHIGATEMCSPEATNITHPIHSHIRKRSARNFRIRDHCCHLAFRTSIGKQFPYQMGVPLSDDVGMCSRQTFQCILTVHWVYDIIRNRVSMVEISLVRCRRFVCCMFERRWKLGRPPWTSKFHVGIQNRI